MSLSISPHPHGVLPEGNLFLLGSGGVTKANKKRCQGLGPMMSKLDDNTLIKVLSYSGSSTLAALCSTSDTLHAFASFEEFWQAACLRRAVKSTRQFVDLREPFTYFCGSWKDSYLAVMREIHGTGSTSIPLLTRTRGVSIFSDVLYRPHELAHKTNACVVPKGPPSSICTRIKPDADATLDAAGFSLIYEAGTGKPVIIEPAGASTSSSSSSNSNASIWDDESLFGRFGDHVFHASGVNFKLKDYFTYARTNKVAYISSNTSWHASSITPLHIRYLFMHLLTHLFIHSRTPPPPSNTTSQQDDQPLYLFDPTFDRSAPDLLQAYTIPSYFRDDLFSLLENEDCNTNTNSSNNDITINNTNNNTNTKNNNNNNINNSSSNSGNSSNDKNNHNNTPTTPTSPARPDYRWLLIGGLRSGNQQTN